MLAAADLTQVLIQLIIGLPAIIAAVGTILLRRDMKGPSGAKPGVVAERAHDAVLANNMLLKTLIKGGKLPASSTTDEPPPPSEAS